LTGKHVGQAARRNVLRISIAVTLALGLIAVTVAAFRSGPTTSSAAERNAVAVTEPATAATTQATTAPTQPAPSVTRTPEERAARSELRAAPTPSPTPSKSKSTSAPSTNNNTNPGSGKVVNSGSCPVSFYADPQPTASGEPFNPNALTAAHKTLRFNTRVRVTNPANGKSVIVRINDRGPYSGSRCLDLSRAAFAAIAPLGQGVLNSARYEVLG
jgi:rare lipoprotein A